MLVPAKCTSCGDTIQVDRDKEAAVCPSCGSAFIVEKAINNYGTIINAQNVEIHTDGITADNLLGIALEESRHKNYVKAGEYITKAREHGAKHPIFRFCGEFLTEYRNKSAAVKKDFNKINELLRDIQQAHALKQDDAQDQQYRGRVEDFYLLIVDLIYSEIVAARKAAVKAMEFPKNYQENKDSFHSCLKFTSALENFAVWGKQELFFADGSEETKNAQEHPGKLLQSWAREILECLRALSLSYLPDQPEPPKEEQQDSSSKPSASASEPSTASQPANVPPQPIKYVMTAAEAQHIYDLAEKMYPLAGYSTDQPLEKRLIAPSKGGEGVHIHRITSTDPLGKSISDGEYYGSLIKDLPQLKAEQIMRGSSINYGYLVLSLLIMWPITYIVWCIISFIFGNSFFLCYLITASGLYAAWAMTRYDHFAYCLQKYKELYLEWKASPAQGTKACGLTFQQFVSCLNTEAGRLLEEKAAVILSDSPDFALDSTGFPALNPSHEDSGGKSSPMRSITVTVVILVAAYFLALRWCPDKVVPPPEPEPANVTAPEPAPAVTAAEEPASTLSENRVDNTPAEESTNDNNITAKTTENTNNENNEALNIYESIKYNNLQKLFLDLHNTTTEDILQTLIQKYSLNNDIIHHDNYIIYRLRFSNFPYLKLNYNPERKDEVFEHIDVYIDTRDNSLKKDNHMMLAIYRYNADKEVLLYNYGTYSEFNADKPTAKLSGYYYSNAKDKNKNSIIDNNDKKITSNYHFCTDAREAMSITLPKQEIQDLQKAIWQEAFSGVSKNQQLQKYNTLQKIFLAITPNIHPQDLEMLMDKYKVKYEKGHYKDDYYSIETIFQNTNKKIIKSLFIVFSDDDSSLKYARYSVENDYNDNRDPKLFAQAFLYNYGEDTFWRDFPGNQYSGYYYYTAKTNKEDCVSHSSIYGTSKTIYARAANALDAISHTKL